MTCPTCGGKGFITKSVPYLVGNDGGPQIYSCWSEPCPNFECHETPKDEPAAEEEDTA